MSTSTIEALASAGQDCRGSGIPADYEGTATPQAHRASEAIQEQIRERSSPPTTCGCSALHLWVRRRCAWSKRWAGGLRADDARG
jgi:hypothetical protein